jgi:predicted nucleic acid-binding protein
MSLCASTTAVTHSARWQGKRSRSFELQVYDTRLVASMHVHGITHLLTFNVSDFARFPGITAAHPQDI